MPANQPAIIDIEGGIALAVVTDITLPTETDETEIAALREQALENMLNETFMLYINAQQDKYKASINADLLERTYNRETESF